MELGLLGIGSFPALAESWGIPAAVSVAFLQGI